jgi:opacity protein-like surface antigen
LKRAPFDARYSVSVGWDERLRVSHPVSDRWAIAGYAGIGGFGAGSDITWQALAGMDYRFSRSITGKFGYRYITRTRQVP